MTVAGVTSDAAAVPFTHREDRLRLALPAGLAAGQDVTVHHRVSRHSGRWPAPHQQHPRRAHGLQRELVQPRAPVAADDRPRGRQGHRRVHHHDAGRLSGDRQRRARGSRWISPADCAARTGGRTCRFPRGSTPWASRASPSGTPDSCAACRSSTGCSRRTPRRASRSSSRTRAASFEFYRRLRRPVRVSEARARGSGRHGRRHRAREQHLLRREGHHRRQRSRWCTKSRTSGSATPSPNTTGTTSG